MTQTTTHQPKYRRPLNDKQTLLLKLIYKFRFITVDHIQTAQKQKDQSTVNGRLKVLRDQCYIDRHYDSSYKLQGKHAVYFITTKGINLLKTLEGLQERTLRNMSRDKSARESFVGHSLNIFDLYNLVRQNYPDTFNFYTTNELAKDEQYPELLPDAYLEAKNDDHSNYFLESFDVTVPLFLMKQKIRGYTKHYLENGWDEYPGVILIVENPNALKTIKKYVAKVLDASGLDVQFSVIPKDDVAIAYSSF